MYIGILFGVPLQGMYVSSTLEVHVFVHTYLSRQMDKIIIFTDKMIPCCSLEINTDILKPKALIPIFHSYIHTNNVTKLTE